MVIQGLNNVFDNIGKNIDISILDATKILKYTLELLSDDRTVCQKNICKLQTNKEQQTKLSLLTTIVTHQELSKFIDSQDEIELVFTIDENRKKLSQVELITKSDTKVIISFDFT